MLSCRSIIILPLTYRLQSTSNHIFAWGEVDQEFYFGVLFFFSQSTTPHHFSQKQSKTKQTKKQLRNNLYFTLLPVFKNHMVVYKRIFFLTLCLSLYLHYTHRLNSCGFIIRKKNKIGRHNTRFLDLRFSWLFQAL